MKRVTCVNSLDPRKEEHKREWRRVLSLSEDEGEIIESDVFPTLGITWIDNSLATQERLRELGREDLIRPLE